MRKPGRPGLLLEVLHELLGADDALAEVHEVLRQQVPPVGVQRAVELLGGSLEQLEVVAGELDRLAEPAGLLLGVLQRAVHVPLKVDEELHGLQHQLRGREGAQQQRQQRDHEGLLSCAAADDGESDVGTVCRGGEIRCDASDVLQRQCGRGSSFRTFGQLDEVRSR